MTTSGIGLSLAGFAAAHASHQQSSALAGSATMHPQLHASNNGVAQPVRLVDLMTYPGAAASLPPLPNGVAEPFTPRDPRLWPKTLASETNPASQCMYEAHLLFSTPVRTEALLLQPSAQRTYTPAVPENA